MKLNLASSTDIREGYVNLDIRKIPGTIQADARFLPFKNNVFDEVLASHFLEHLLYKTIFAVVLESKRVLKPSGKMVVCVPDFEVLAREWPLATPHMKMKWWNYAIYGSGNYSNDFHVSALDSSLLSLCFQEAGFQRANRWHDAEHPFWLWVEAYLQ